MKALFALMHRELIEHRGAFITAPAVLLGLFTLTFGTALLLNRFQIPLVVGAPTAAKFYEVAFIGMAGLWFVYLLIALFFYYADAFNADRRNNSMLFWKSMPVSDFGVLASKLLSGLTLFPAIVFCMLIVTGLILYGLTGLAVSVLPALAVPSVPEIVSSSIRVGMVALVYIGLAMLWYAPLFAWVGMLSTAVGRWSIPLAFLIPGIAIIVENIFVRGMPEIIGSFMFASGPRGGFIADYLSYRLHFGFEDWSARDAVLSEQPLDGAATIGMLLAGIDWMQLAGGVVVAVLLVFAASEYRRRVLAT